VYVDCTEAVCIARDPKGIYRKAREGGATTVPGVQVPYETPNHPEVVVSGEHQAADASARQILEYLIEQGWVSR
jgi:adenylylsulfate kinase-like enzyme